MIIGAVQLEVIKGDKERNLAKVNSLIDRKVDLVVLPELFSTGYFFESPSEIMNIAERIPDGFTTEKLCKIAREKRCHLAGAITEADGGELYIAAVVAGPGGYIGKHRKRHLTDREKSFYSFGTESPVFNIGGCTVGLLICFEGWFPESARELMVKGARVLCHTALTTSQDTLDVMRVRALENNAFVILANSISTEYLGGNAVTFRGDSRVIGCNGIILANADREEKLIAVEIDENLAGRGLGDCGDLIAETKKHTYTMFP